MYPFATSHLTLWRTYRVILNLPRPSRRVTGPPRASPACAGEEADLTIPLLQQASPRTPVHVTRLCTVESLSHRAPAPSTHTLSPRLLKALVRAHIPGSAGRYPLPRPHECL